MSETKKQFAELLLLTANGFKHSEEDNIDIRDVLTMVDDVRDGVIWEYFQGERQDEGFIASSLITTYPSNDGKKAGPVVKYHEQTDRYYTDLPEKPLDLPSGRGLWLLSPMRGQEKPFIPARLGSVSLMANSDAGGLEGERGFELRGLRVDFMRNFPNIQFPVGTELYCEIITTGAATGENDILNMPSAIKEIVFDRVLAKLQQRPTDDTIDQKGQP